jgi:predicted ATPase/class 3 adenylate cyclase
MAAAQGGPSPDATSGTLTFLFTDLAGSTRLWELHPDAMKHALGRHDAILRGAIEASGGDVVKTTGDGVMAVFAAAPDGVAASLAAQLDLAAEPWDETGPLRVRMGLHAGEAERRGADYFGPTVNRAARIMAAGHGGQVLLSASAAALAADRLPAGASLRDLGDHRLKDLGRPERVFQLEHGGLEATFPMLRTPGFGPSNLPALSGVFVGRTDELEEIERRLTDEVVRLLTLTGPGGTGKTSLAVLAAARQVDRFPDGVYFVDLSTSREADAFILALARTLGLGETTERSLLDELTDQLRERRVLLVLDNFEQVRGGAEVVVQLLGDCPGVAFLVTSREPLHVRDERVLPVPPLTLPPQGARRSSAANLGRYEAVQLFVERARAARPDFELTDDNATVVGEICVRLDGLPLAIELAAARLRLFSPEALLDRLGSRLELLRSTTRDLPARQQTLRSTIEWSYQLLDPGEQRLFELLAAFADSDVSAVETVAAAATASDESGAVDAPVLDALDGLASLLDKSLIRRVEAPGEPRFAMLETIREYAAERLDAHPGFRARVARAHAVHYADLAAGQRRELVGSGRDRALATMTEEVGNLRIAWQHWAAEADLDQLTKLADSLLILNDARGWYRDTVSLTTDLLGVLAATESSPERVGQEITLRTTLARALMATRGYTPEVEDAYARALDLFEGGDVAPDGDGQNRQYFAVLRALASLYLLRAEFDKANRLGQRLLELAERHRDPGMRIDGQLVVGSTLVFMSDIKGGLRLLDEAIESFGSSPARAYYGFGNDPRVACLTTSAIALWLLGFPDRAVERMTSAIALSGEIGHPFTSAFARFHSGLLHLLRGEPEVVLERALAVLAVAEEHEFQIWSAVGTCLLGAAETSLGRIDEGLAQIRKGMDLYKGIRTPPVFWPMLLFVDARSSLAAGRSRDGLIAIDPAIDMMSQGPGSALLPEFYLAKGDLLGTHTADSQADLEPSADPGSSPAYWYRRAFDHASALDARMSLLRAAIRMRRLAGRGDAAESNADQLAVVLETFTEGFDTADLREARQLLEVATG